MTLFSGSLYHYTTNEAAENIRATNSLYCTHFLQMNDNHQVGKRLDYLNKYLRSKVKDDDAFHRLNRMIYTTFPRDIFIGCLSRASNCRKMSAKYGRNGVCLEVDASKLCSANTDLLCQYMPAPMSYGMREYKEGIETHLGHLNVPNLLNIHYQVMNFPMVDLDAKLRLFLQNTDAVVFLKAVTEVTIAAMLTKDSRYSYEQEIRLLSGVGNLTAPTTEIIHYGKLRRIVNFPEGFILNSRNL